MAFAAWCVRCDGPPGGRATVITTLVPVSIQRSEDQRTWLVRELPASEVAEERDAESIGGADCVECGEFQDGDELSLDSDTADETHFPVRCTSRGGSTRFFVVEPAIIARSHRDDEWFVVILTDEEIALARQGVDLDEEPWLS